MNILINTTIMFVGGGVQLADSIVRLMVKNKSHHFLLVYPNTMTATAEAINSEDNVEIFHYEMPKYYLGLISGRNKTLDSLVKDRRIDVVFTVMGPSRWRPRVPHLVGFARCQAVIPESPFWGMISKEERIQTKLKNLFLINDFRKSSKAFWTENDFISSRLYNKLHKRAIVYTVTSTYNQVYDNKAEWDYSVQFPPFDGVSFLTIAANYPHKNLRIIPKVIEYLTEKHPDMNYRVVMTLNGNEFGVLSEDVKKHIVFVGPVTINQCPYMYEQSYVMLLPSLLECFSACYAEAMRMGRAILVPGLGFAKGLCDDAALYYEPTDVSSLGEAMYLLYTDRGVYNDLVKNGKRRLKDFNSAYARADRLLEIIEGLPNLYEDHRVVS